MADTKTPGSTQGGPGSGYHKFTAPQLRRLLRKRRIRITGLTRKAHFIEKLQAFDATIRLAPTDVAFFAERLHIHRSVSISPRTADILQCIIAHPQAADTILENAVVDLMKPVFCRDMKEIVKAILKHPDLNDTSTKAETAKLPKVSYHDIMFHMAVIARALITIDKLPKILRHRDRERDLPFDLPQELIDMILEHRPAFHQELQDSRTASLDRLITQVVDPIVSKALVPGTRRPSSRPTMDFPMLVILLTACKTICRGIPSLFDFESRASKVCGNLADHVLHRVCWNIYDSKPKTFKLEKDKQGSNFVEKASLHIWNSYHRGDFGNKYGTCPGVTAATGHAGDLELPQLINLCRDMDWYKNGSNPLQSED